MSETVQASGAPRITPIKSKAIASVHDKPVAHGIIWSGQIHTKEPPIPHSRGLATPHQRHFNSAEALVIFFGDISRVLDPLDEFLDRPLRRTVATSGYAPEI
jgi:hypothetical protein